MDITDKKILLSLLDKTGADYKVWVEEEGKPDYIEIQNSNRDKSYPAPGYTGFTSCWYFNKEGDLIAIGNWK